MIITAKEVARKAGIYVPTTCVLIESETGDRVKFDIAVEAILGTDDSPSDVCVVLSNGKHGEIQIGLMSGVLDEGYWGDEDGLFLDGNEAEKIRFAATIIIAYALNNPGEV